MRIIETADGSLTLYNEELKETYHSVRGALGESIHVYIQQGLQKRTETELCILEVGFGTGLNALLTMEHRPSGQHIVYFSLEPFLPGQELLQSYYEGFSEKPARLDALPHMLNCTGKTESLEPGFSFRLLRRKLEELEPSDLSDADGKLRRPDLVYFDAFAPSRQPDIWDIGVLEKLKELMSEGGMLVTYCAQGNFKRNLKKLGFTLNCPPGAYGKREMTVAIKAGPAAI